MASHPGPLPPPLAPGQFRPHPPNGGAQQQQRLQGGQGHPSRQLMAMPIRKPLQQSVRIQDISPPKILDDDTCLKKLTSYAAYTIRKVTPRDPREKPTWARAEVIHEQFPQEDTIKQIKRLNEGKRTVSDKKAALAQFQQGQITSLLDDLGSRELDTNFHWSLVQIDRKEKPVSGTRGANKKSLYETVTMTVYVKRAPMGNLSPTQLYETLERVKADRLRPPPSPPPQPPQPPQQGGGGQGGGLGGGHGGPHGGSQPQGGNWPRPLQQGGGQGGGNGGPLGGNHPPPQPGFVQIDRNGPPPGGNNRPQNVKQQQQKRGGNRGPKKYHERDSSAGSSASDSYDSDGSGSISSDEDSARTTISTRSPPPRSRRHSKGASRSHSFHRESRPKYHLEPRSPSPHRHRAVDAFGGMPAQHRPYAPDVPRAVPGIGPLTSAYQAGKEDAMAERFGAERFARQPRQIIHPIIERIIEPRPVMSYGRTEPPFADRPRLIEPRYMDERYTDDLRSAEDDLIVRQRRAEEYMNRKQIDLDRIERRPLDPRESLGRRTSDFERRPHAIPEFLDRRPSEVRPRERREVRQDFFDQSPSERGFPRNQSPPRNFRRDFRPFAPTAPPRQNPVTSSNSSSRSSGPRWTGW